MSDTHEVILQDLIEEIDDAGACLAASTECRPRVGLTCGIKEFNIAVASASAKAKRRRNAIEQARAERICWVCAAKGDADHLGFCSESW